ncbi:MAG TPA: LUD domain-containing protein [Longimicrobiales bacterium]|jgi:L-lactate dehydrogenase complex protein LldG|nr:LUD domain-containing protein [Longimicrobiales bacterium]
MEADGAGARERILGRIREALSGRRRPEHPGDLPDGAGAPAPEEDASTARRVEAFARRFEASGGQAVLLRDEDEARRWLAGFVESFRHAAVSEGVGEAFRPDLPGAPPEDADLGVSRALAAAAQTGSLVLGSGEGRRTQLLPPVHLVWVDAADVRATLGGALAAVRNRGPLPAVVALHSGPSKSADIGRIVVTGVHGPGRVVAAVVGRDSA